jgi:uncharacterized protein (TIGR02145 family)
MVSRNLIKIFVLFTISISLFSCPHPIPLPGKIKGTVFDAVSYEPVRGAIVRIIQTGDSVSTGNDGTYLLSNIDPGNYEIQVTKSDYYPIKENVEVIEAETRTIDFYMEKIQMPVISPKYLDFCLEETSLSFTILNTSADKPLTCAFQKSQLWISVYPSTDEIGNELHTFNVNIDRTGLSADTIKESITLILILGTERLPEIRINVYLNGIYDTRTNTNNKVVKIGSQIWMQENMNVTSYTDGTNIPVVDDKNNWMALTSTDKACCWYNNNLEFKKIHGVLYTWGAAMNGATSSSKKTSGVQGVCPEGWHLPSLTEWSLLVDYLANNGYGCNEGEYSVVKSLAIKSGWDTCLNQPCSIGYNQWSNNSSGFTARPGGIRSYEDGKFYFKGAGTVWYTATEFNAYWAYGVAINCCDVLPLKLDEVPFQNGSYVRCLKDP